MKFFVRMVAVVAMVYVSRQIESDHSVLSDLIAVAALVVALSDGNFDKERETGRTLIQRAGWVPSIIVFVTAVFVGWIMTRSMLGLIGGAVFAIVHEGISWHIARAARKRIARERDDRKKLLSGSPHFTEPQLLELERIVRNTKWSLDGVEKFAPLARSDVPSRTFFIAAVGNALRTTWNANMELSMMIKRFHETGGDLNLSHEKETVASADEWIRRNNPAMSAMHEFARGVMEGSK